VGCGGVWGVGGESGWRGKGGRGWQTEIMFTDIT